jgi:hypothetical protein
MKKNNNQVVLFAIIGMFLLTADSFCKNQIRDSVSGQYRDTNREETVKPAQNDPPEDTETKGSITTLQFSEKGIQSFDSIENEGKNIRFYIGIIL